MCVSAVIVFFSVVLPLDENSVFWVIAPAVMTSTANRINFRHESCVTQVAVASKASIRFSGNVAQKRFAAERSVSIMRAARFQYKCGESASVTSLCAIDAGAD